MKDICKRKKESWLADGRSEGGKDYYFQDNGSNILAVAHLDSVQKYTHCEFLRLPGEPRVYSPVLDDRLGVYIITDVLPKLGLKYDILLTDDEEIGQSTAQFFSTEKKYNWMFQFDRKGNDAVVYDYDTIDWKDAVKTHFKLGIGSFSDICELEHLGCCGINIGTCYDDYHSKLAYANLTQLEVQIKAFAKFYHQFKDVHFAYTPSPRYGYGWDYPTRFRSFVDERSCTFCSEPIKKGDIMYNYYGYDCCESCYYTDINENKGDFEDDRYEDLYYSSNGSAGFGKLSTKSKTQSLNRKRFR